MEKPTSDEKVLAALAHASVLFAFFGPVGPTLIWAFQRNKSKYVRFHALQAMGYQALTFWAWFIGIFFAVFGGIVISIIIAAVSNIETTDMSVFPFIVQPIIMLSMFGLFGLFLRLLAFRCSFFVVFFNAFYISFEYIFSFINQYDTIADFFHLFHSVG